LAVGYWLLAIGCWLLAVGCWLLSIGCYLLAIGYWLLAIVYWLLSIGYWLLAIVYWLLANYLHQVLEELVFVLHLVLGHLQQLAVLILHLVQLLQQMQLVPALKTRLPFGSALEVQQLLLVPRLLLQLHLHSSLYGVIMGLLLPELHALPTLFLCLLVLL
jgi:hypothetical protein